VPLAGLGEESRVGSNPGTVPERGLSLLAVKR
jgi:hypothetical protein